MPKRIKKQLAETLPLVAIELGSNSVRAMAAEKVGTDMLHVLGYEESRRHRCVDRGIVVQTSDAGYMINSVLKLLANRINVEELPAAFVLLGGASMQVVPVQSKRDFIRKHDITNSVLDSMEDECRKKIEDRYPGVAVLDLIPAYFVVDGQEQEDIPTSNQRAILLEAHYIAFVGKRELKDKVEAGFDRASKSIEQTFIRPDALLSAFAFEDPSVLNDGCAVLDMGAETTTLSIYKGTQYITMKVLAEGGNKLTQALMDHNLSPEKAERMKVQFGTAAPEYVEKNFTMQVPLANGDTWKTTSMEVAEILKPVLDTMLDPLMNMLNEYSTRIRCLYITGGASMLAGMADYLSDKTSIKVLYGSHAGLLDRKTPDEYCSPAYASLVGALILGSDYRDAHPGKLIAPPKIRRVDQLEQKVFEFFTEQ